PQVWKSDPFEIQAVLRAQGFAGEDVKVELVEVKVDADGGEAQQVVLDTLDVTIPEDGDGQQRLTFTHVPEEPGMRAYNVRVAPIADESNQEDNQPAAPLRVKVLDDNARILMISGTANWEYRALTRLFMREKMLNISCWLQTLDKGREQQGNTPISVLPSTKEALFEYDVVIMVDPDPAEFDAAWIDLLSEFVREHSGGLLFMTGPINSGKFIMNNATSKIQDLLPVSLGDVAALQADALGSTYETQWPLAVVASNVDRPIMRFFPDEAETLMQWKEMPGVFWSFPASRPKPASRVLIEHSNPNLIRDQVPRPLLVTGQFGSGRTTYIGFDGTWRWRVKGYDGEFFKRFWIQTTRYLVEGRALAGKRRGVIESDRFRYQVGDRIRLNAQLREPNFDPYDKEEVKAELSIPGREAEELTFKKIPNQPGKYEATIAASAAGNHSVTISLPGGDGETSIDADFTVMLPIRETQESWLDKPGLIELAKSTGGQYFDVDQAASLASAVPSRVRRYETQSEPMPLWDNRTVLIALALLLTLEWAFRKKFKLL
ncbi:MAG: putative membrane protein, partial [Verrucomicrobiales bacterium]